MTNYSLITLGELLSSDNETIKRNAVSILKVLQKKYLSPSCKSCDKCGRGMTDLEYVNNDGICDLHR
jgi:4-hydroxy-3-methylbut-2-en-1-yl diphosphate synthase IspG/GcpE